MTDTLPAEKLLKVLGDLQSLEGACSVLAETLRSELEAEGVALFRFDSQAACLAHTSGVQAEALQELVSDCVSSRSPSGSGKTVALPLQFEGVPVGALVSCGGESDLDTLPPEATNLAALLARASGGGIPGYLSPSRFLAEVRREEERTLRSGRPFAVISVDSEKTEWFPPHIVRDLRSWTRSTDTCGCLRKGCVGVILPDTGFAAAHTAALRFRDRIAESHALRVKTAFVVFPAAVGDHQSGGRFDLNRATWTFIPPRS